MEAPTYHLQAFEGPLDLLLSLIQKNKVDISDIPIALICDQYMEYLRKAEQMDMDLASEFLVMASELMLLKSRMLLPRAEPEEEDPRAALAEALLKYKQAKEGAAALSARYPTYAGRLVKDTDEMSVDKTFVADQSVASLCLAVRRIISYREEHPPAEKVTFTPMIASPIVPVESKIVGILRHFEVPSSRSGVGGSPQKVSVSSLLADSVSLPDLIAIFLGILELIKMRRLRILDDPDDPQTVFGREAVLVEGQRETDSEAQSLVSEYDSVSEQQDARTI